MSTNRGTAADCYPSSHLNEQHTRKSKGRKSQQSVQEIYRIMSKASSWKTEFSQESETCCSLCQIKSWMSDTWPVTSFQSAGVRASGGPKEGKHALNFSVWLLSLIEELFSVSHSVGRKSCLWILVSLHGTTSQNATIHITMSDPGISQQVFVFETLSSVLQTSTQENTSESCIGMFLQETTQWQKW